MAGRFLAGDVKVSAAGKPWSGSVKKDADNEDVSRRDEVSGGQNKCGRYTTITTSFSYREDRPLRPPKAGPRHGSVICAMTV